MFGTNEWRGHSHGGLNIDQGSMLIGELRQSNQMVLATLAEIKDALKTGAEVHRDFEKRISAIESPKKDDRPLRMEAFLKYGIALVTFLISLRVTGSAELATKALTAALSGAGSH